MLSWRISNEEASCHYLVKTIPWPPDGALLLGVGIIVLRGKTITPFLCPHCSSGCVVLRPDESLWIMTLEPHGES